MTLIKIFSLAARRKPAGRRIHNPEDGNGLFDMEAMTGVDPFQVHDATTGRTPQRLSSTRAGGITAGKFLDSRGLVGGSGGELTRVGDQT